MRLKIIQKILKLIPILLIISAGSLVAASSTYLIKFKSFIFKANFWGLSIFLILLVWRERSLRNLRKGVAGYSLKLIFSALLSGRVFGWDAALILFLFSVALNWIPSFLEQGVYLKSLCLALVCINGFLYLSCRSLESYIPKRKFSNQPEKRKILIRAISFAINDENRRREYLEALQNTPCDKLIHNQDLDRLISNLGPLFKAVYYHAHEGPLEKAYLLVSDKLAICNSKNDEKISELNKNILNALKTKIETCVGKELVEFVEKEKGLDFEDFHSLREKFLSLLKEIQKNYDSSDITVDISGGTSVVSAALILIAIKGNIQAQYISQSDPRTLKVINTDVLEISDLFQEFAEKFRT